MNANDELLRKNNGSEGLLFDFTLVLFSIITFSLLSSLYDALKISFKDAVSDKAINLALKYVIANLGRPPFINPTVVGISSVAMSFVAIFTIGIHYINISRMKNDYNIGYGVHLAIIDWTIGLFFFSIGQSLGNLHEKVIMETDTIWFLFLLGFLTIVLRIFLTSIPKNGDDLNRRMILIHYLIICIIIFINGLIYDRCPLRYAVLIETFRWTLVVYTSYLVLAFIFISVNSHIVYIGNKILNIIGLAAAIFLWIIMEYMKHEFIKFFHFGKFAGPWPGILFYAALTYILLRLVVPYIPMIFKRDIVSKVKQIKLNLE